jgi:hypothetical protein
VKDLTGETWTLVCNQRDFWPRRECWGVIGPTVYHDGYNGKADAWRTAQGLARLWNGKARRKVRGKWEEVDYARQA